MLAEADILRLGVRHGKVKLNHQVCGFLASSYCLTNVTSQHAQHAKAGAVCRCVDLNQGYVASDSLQPEVPGQGRRASSSLGAALTLRKSHMCEHYCTHSGVTNLQTP